MKTTGADVVVVGAGLAGLTAALDLQAQGVSVVLLEGGSRVGGRARTVVGDGEVLPEGLVVESGGEWVDAYHDNVRALIDRYELTLDSAHRSWDDLSSQVMTPDGTLHGYRENPGILAASQAFADLAEGLAEGVIDPARPQDHPDAARLDALSAADLVAEIHMSPIARHRLEWALRSEYAGDLDQVSLLYVAQQQALERDGMQTLDARDETFEAWRVRGGVSRLALAMAAEVGDALRLSTSVTAIESQSDSVRVIARDDEWIARSVVIATSSAALQHIHVSGAGSDAVEAARSIHMGTVTKTIQAWSSRDWQYGWLTSNTPWGNVYESTGAQDSDIALLTSYVGSRSRAAALPAHETDRVTGLRSLVTSVAPTMGRPVGAGLSRAWADHPRFGGSYAVYAPRQITSSWESVRTPEGPVVLAGEYVGTWSGYLEGAVQSGHDAASYCLTR